MEGVGRVFIVEVEFSATSLSAKDGSQNAITSGMTVRADIKSGKETWMTWLLRMVNLKD
jgi:hypothetical protein